MTLRCKTLVGTVLSAMAMVAVLYISSRWVFLASVNQQEEEGLRRNVRRVVGAVADHVNQIDEQLMAWSNWDDSYAYMADHNSAFIDSNLSADAMASIRMNVMLFVDEQGNIIWKGAVDPETQQPVALPEMFTHGALPQDHILLRHGDTNTGVQGLFLLAEGPMLLSARPILTTARKGPPRGTILFGRFLDGKKIEHLSELTQLSLAVCRLDEANEDGDFLAATMAPGGEAPVVVQVKAENEIRGYALLKDLHGDPALVLRVSDSRETCRQGMAAVRWVTIYSLIVGSLIVGFIALMIEQLVLRRLTNLGAQVNAIAASQDPSARISDRRSDEIGRLGRSINSMLAALAQANANVRMNEQALRESQARLRTIIDAIPAGVVIVDQTDQKILDVNPAALGLIDLPRERVVGVACHQFIRPTEQPQRPICDLHGSVANSEGVLLRSDGQSVPILKTVVQFILDDRPCLLKSFIDITVRKRAEEELKGQSEQLEGLVKERSENLLEAQRQVLQAEKLASVGRLAAGVAHEINTPIQYVGDNLNALSDFLSDLQSLVTNYRELVELVARANVLPAEIDAIRTVEREKDIDFILDDAPKAVVQGLDGVQRVAAIVRAMKDFSHVQSGARSPANINQCLQSTLTVAVNEYKYVADVETDFGELPLVQCYPGELNQVFLNLLVNAAHAIQDTGRRGKISVRTRLDNGSIEVAIGDTGTGIPENIRSKIFDPFFTTKPLGKGTGQGLCIAYQIVVQKHGGTLTYETEVGRGTTFKMRIPLEAAQTPEETREVSLEQDANPVCR